MKINGCIIFCKHHKEPSNGGFFLGDDRGAECFSSTGRTSSRPWDRGPAATPTGEPLLEVIVSIQGECVDTVIIQHLPGCRNSAPGEGMVQAISNVREVVLGLEHRWCVFMSTRARCGRGAAELALGIKCPRMREKVYDPTTFNNSQTNRLDSIGGTVKNNAGKRVSLIAKIAISCAIIPRRISG